MRKDARIIESTTRAVPRIFCKNQNRVIGFNSEWQVQSFSIDIWLPIMERFVFCKIGYAVHYLWYHKERLKTDNIAGKSRLVRSTIASVIMMENGIDTQIFSKNISTVVSRLQWRRLEDSKYWYNCLRNLM